MADVLPSLPSAVLGGVTGCLGRAGLRGSRVWVDAPSSAVLAGMGGLPLLLSLGARCVSSLELEGGGDGVHGKEGHRAMALLEGPGASVMGEGVEGKVVVVSGKLLDDSLEDVVRVLAEACKGGDGQVKRVLILTSVPEPVYAMLQHSRYDENAFVVYGDQVAAMVQGCERVEVRYIPLPVRLLSENVFTLPARSAAGIEKRLGGSGAFDFLPPPDLGQELDNGEGVTPPGITLQAAALAALGAEMGVKLEPFALGPASRSLGRILLDFPPPPNSVIEEQGFQGTASLILLDRTADLASPCCHGEAFDRILASSARDSCTGEPIPVTAIVSAPASAAGIEGEREVNTPLFNVAGALNHEDEGGREWNVALLQSTRDMLLALRTGLRKALVAENAVAPLVGRPKTSLAALVAEIRTLAETLAGCSEESLYRHKTLLAVTNSTICAVEKTGPSWDALVSAERVLGTVSAAEGTSSITSQLKEYLTKTMEGDGVGDEEGTSLMSLEDVLTLAVVSYVLAGELSSHERPMGMRNEHSLRSVVVECVEKNPAECAQWLSHMEVVAAKAMGSKQTMPRRGMDERMDVPHLPTEPPPSPPSSPPGPPKVIRFSKVKPSGKGKLGLVKKPAFTKIVKEKEITAEGGDTVPNEASKDFDVPSSSTTGSLEDGSKKVEDNVINDKGNTDNVDVGLDTGLSGNISASGSNSDLWDDFGGGVVVRKEKMPVVAVRRLEGNTAASVVEPASVSQNEKVNAISSFEDSDPVRVNVTGMDGDFKDDNGANALAKFAKQELRNESVVQDALAVGSATTRTATESEEIQSTTVESALVVDEHTPVVEVSPSKAVSDLKVVGTKPKKIVGMNSKLVGSKPKATSVKVKSVALPKKSKVVIVPQSKPVEKKADVPDQVQENLEEKEPNLVEKLTTDKSGDDEVKVEVSDASIMPAHLPGDTNPIDSQVEEKEESQAHTNPESSQTSRSDSLASGGGGGIPQTDTSNCSMEHPAETTAEQPTEDSLTTEEKAANEDCAEGKGDVPASVPKPVVVIKPKLVVVKPKPEAAKGKAQAPKKPKLVVAKPKTVKLLSKQTEKGKSLDQGDDDAATSAPSPGARVDEENTEKERNLVQSGSDSLHVAPLPKSEDNSVGEEGLAQAAPYVDHSIESTTTKAENSGTAQGPGFDAGDWDDFRGDDSNADGEEEEGLADQGWNDTFGFDARGGPNQSAAEEKWEDVQPEQDWGGNFDFNDQFEEFDDQFEGRGIDAGTEDPADKSERAALKARVNALFGIFNQVAKARRSLKNTPSLALLQQQTEGHTSLARAIATSLTKQNEIPGLEHISSMVGGLLGMFGVRASQPWEHPLVIIYFVGGLSTKDIKDSLEAYQSSSRLLIGGSNLLSQSSMPNLLFSGF